MAPWIHSGGFFNILSVCKCNIFYVQFWSEKGKAALCNNQVEEIWTHRKLGNKNTVSDLNQPVRDLAAWLPASRSQKGKSDAHMAEKNCCCEKDTHPITSIMLWRCGVVNNMGECLMGRGKTELNVSPTNFRSKQKTIFKKNLELKMQNEPKHGKLKVLPWPSMPPDLNSTGNVDLKRAVSAQQPRNLTELEDFCEE